MLYLVAAGFCLAMAISDVHGIIKNAKKEEAKWVILVDAAFTSAAIMLVIYYLEAYFTRT